MDIRNYKAVIILFAPGQGGNHLANIISTSGCVEKRTESNRYSQDLQYYYSSSAKDAHINPTRSNVCVMNPMELHDMLSKSNRPCVIVGHIDEAYYVYDYIKNLGQYIFITFENFNLTDNIIKRMKIYDDTTPTTISLLKLLYREKVVSKLFDTKNVLALDPAQLFEESPRDLLSDLNRELSLDLDLDFCLDLHKKWFNKIK